MNNNRYSYLTELQCSGCGRPYPHNELQTYCSFCQSPLIAIYDLQAIRREVDRERIVRRHEGMWRWHELLPLQKHENIVSLGEGDTPLLFTPRLGKELGVHSLHVKDESHNPTGSFKARGISAAISKAKELGVQKVIIPTAGNAGGAMAAYASRAGLQAHIFMPKDTPPANVQECIITGAGVTLIDGLISDAAGMAGEKARQEGWFDVSTFKEPYRAEGKKVMGYEIAQHFHWKLPDVIIYPTGGGTGLIGIWKAINELAELGWLQTTSRPRIVAVQAEGCAPVVKAYQEHAPFCDYWHGAQTIASGLRVPKSFADQLILRTLLESNGCSISVSDSQIIQAQRLLASREGIFAAPEGAATLAGLILLLQSGWIHPDEQVLLLNTGTGLKYIEQMNGYASIEQNSH